MDDEQALNTIADFVAAYGCESDQRVNARWGRACDALGLSLGSDYSSERESAARSALMRIAARYDSKQQF